MSVDPKSITEALKSDATVLEWLDGEAKFATIAICMGLLSSAMFALALFR